MFFDYQQGGMVLDGLMTFPDWSYGVVTDHFPLPNQTLIVLRGSATGVQAGAVTISLLGTGAPFLSSINSAIPSANDLLDESSLSILDESSGDIMGE